MSYLKFHKSALELKIIYTDFWIVFVLSKYYIPSPKKNFIWWEKYMRRKSYSRQLKMPYTFLLHFQSAYILDANKHFVWCYLQKNDLNADRWWHFKYWIWDFRAIRIKIFAFLNSLCMLNFWSTVLFNFFIRFENSFNC